MPNMKLRIGIGVGVMLVVLMLSCVGYYLSGAPLHRSEQLCGAYIFGLFMSVSFGLLAASFPFDMG